MVAVTEWEAVEWQDSCSEVFGVQLEVVHGDLY